MDPDEEAAVAIGRAAERTLLVFVNGNLDAKDDPTRVDEARENTGERAAEPNAGEADTTRANRRSAECIDRRGARLLLTGREIRASETRPHDNNPARRPPVRWRFGARLGTTSLDARGIADGAHYIDVCSNPIPDASSLI